MCICQFITYLHTVLTDKCIRMFKNKVLFQHSDLGAFYKILAQFGIQSVRFVANDIKSY